MIWSYFLQPPTWVTWSQSPAANLKSSSQGAGPPYYVAAENEDHGDDHDHVAGDDDGDDHDHEEQSQVIFSRSWTTLLCCC